ncbi:hypothetical protein V8D89_015397 [Ganoderma adspersum]
MSSQSDEQADIILSYTIGNACGYAVLTLLTCEWLFTIQSEIGLFWRRTLSGPTILFILNRYITLANSYLGAFAFSTSVQGCTALIRAAYTINFLQFFPAAVFSTLRVYALGRSWIISSLVFILSNAPTVVNYVTTFGLEHANGSPDGAYGCIELTRDTPEYWDEAAILLARISLIVADIIVLVVTWLATYQKGFIKGGAGQHSIVFVVLYNGSCYFSVMLIFNVLHIALSFASVGYNASQFTSNVTAFTQPYYPSLFFRFRALALTPPAFLYIRITNILIARFLIDLQATHRAAMNINGPGAGHASLQSSAISDANSLRFGGFIGSIGSVLTGGFAEADVEDQDEPKGHLGETLSAAPSQQPTFPDGEA